MSKNNAKRILITGGAGFQGSHLAQRLIKRGHEVSILNTPSERARANISTIKNKVHVMWGSVTDEEAVSKAIRDHDVVFHLAAHINVDESLANPYKTIMVNVAGTLNVLNAVRESGSRLIYVSSCEVYGDGHQGDGILNESAELLPNSPYAASKVAADRICHAFAKSFNIPVVILRPFNIFGERQKSGQFGALIPILVRKALAGEQLSVYGDGKQERDFTYISDIIDAYELVLNSKLHSGEVINLGSGKSTTIIDIAKYISKKLGVKISFVPARPGEVARFIPDTTKARLIGWKPKVSLWQGIDRYIIWAKNNAKNGNVYAKI